MVSRYKWTAIGKIPLVMQRPIQKTTHFPTHLRCRFDIKKENDRGHRVLYGLGERPRLLTYKAFSLFFNLKSEKVITIF